MKGRLPIIRKWGRDLEAGTEYKSSFINWLKFDSFLFCNSFYFRITKENSVLNPLQEAIDEWHAPKLRLKCSFLSSFFMFNYSYFFSTVDSGKDVSPATIFFENAHQDILITIPPFPRLLFFDQKWEMNLIKTQVSPDWYISK